MSKSTKRVRRRPLNSWVDDEEDAIVERLRAEAGLSRAELVRVVMFGYKLPLSRADQQMAIRLLDAIQKLKGEWNKIGSNFNQIALEVNIGREPRMASLESEWHELNDSIQREFFDFRGMLMQALRAERSRNLAEK